MHRIPDPDLRYPGPWQFHRHRYGFAHVVTDRDGRYIVSSVPAECGPLLAAGPQLLETLDRIAAATEPGTVPHELAVGAVESFREGEGIILADWRPYQPASPLRIVGVAA
jgi:hypothetical protein